jgi:apolipoprotein D and lipocalin family protein
VENACRDESFDGEIRRIEGVAWLSDPKESQAKLKVQFFWPFSGDYWIIDLDPEYQIAIVGHPSREYLWVLARTPRLDQAVLGPMLARVEAQGFDLQRLQETPQPTTP